jgi:ribosomal protein S18 acetylase RimI-like enzyme
VSLSSSNVTDVHPLTPERVADLAELFGQGGDPKWCRCAYFRVRGRDWLKSKAADNRLVLEAAVRDDAREGHAPGLVAYRDHEAVGWVGMSPRPEYERLAYSTVLAPLDERPVWSIVCFVVGRKTRGQGVVATLLDAAVAYARDHGAQTLEAYPVEIMDGQRIPSANAYHGTLAMFERAGFSVVERRQFNASSPIRPIVRLEL